MPTRIGGGSLTRYGIEMGAYEIEKIDNDFEIASKNFDWPAVKLMSITAKAILDTMPDNQARDMAISHLLQAAEMVSFSWLIDHNKSVESDVAIDAENSQDSE